MKINFRKIGLKKGMASALNNLSVIYLNISDFKTAIDRETKGAFGDAKSVGFMN